MTLGPRFGKTTWRARCFRRGTSGGTRALIIATYNEHYSWDLGRRVRDIMGTPQYKQVFPGVDIKVAHAVNRIETTAGGVVLKSAAAPRSLARRALHRSTTRSRIAPGADSVGPERSCGRGIGRCCARG